MQLKYRAQAEERKAETAKRELLAAIGAGSPPNEADGAAHQSTTEVPASDRDTYEADQSKTPLYKFYTENQAEGPDAVLEGDAGKYTESEIDSILELVKDNYQNYRKREQVGPFYIKATSTLKFLLEEQAVDASRFQKVRELYKDVTLENTLKLLIRCKLAFDGRRKLLILFQALDQFDEGQQALSDLTEKVAATKSPQAEGNQEAQSGKVVVAQEDQDQIRGITQELMEISERVFKGVQDAEKNANNQKNLNGQPDIFLFKGVDLVSRIRTQLAHAKALVAKLCDGAGEDLSKTQRSAKASEAAVRDDDDSRSAGGSKAALPQSESSRPSKAKASAVASEKASRAKDKGHSSAVPIVHGDKHRAPEGRSSPHFQEEDNGNEEQTLTQMLQKEHMSKTAQEGFYSRRDPLDHQARVGSKKRTHKRVKKRGNLSVQRGPSIAIGGHQSYMGSTPEAYPKAITPFQLDNMGRLHPVMLAGTPLIGASTKASESTGHGMKHAMKRKVNLPSAMPRRQDVIYDLNGRPLYKGGYLRGVEETGLDEQQEYPGGNGGSEHPQDLIWIDGAYQAQGQLRNQERLREEQSHKNSLLHHLKQQRYQAGPGGKKPTQVFMRTEFTSGIYPRHASIQPNQGDKHKLHVKDARVLQLNQQSDLSLPLESARLRNHSGGEEKQHLPDIMNKTLQAQYSNPLASKVPMQAAQQFNKTQKAERPVAASEKSHIFNPRAKSLSKRAQTEAPSGPGTNNIPSLRTASNGGNDEMGKQSREIDKLGLNRSSIQRDDGEASRLLDPNSQSQAIGGTARHELAPCNRSVDQGIGGAAEAGVGPKGAAPALLGQASAPGQGMRGAMNMDQRGADRGRKANLSRKLSPLTAFPDRQNAAGGLNTISGQSWSTITPSPFVKRGRQELSGAPIQNSARGHSYSKFGDQHIADSQHGEMSQKDISAYVSQNNKYGQPNSPGRASYASYMHSLATAGAMGSHYLGNSNKDHFTSEFSNIWLLPNDVMFHDTSLNSDFRRKEREARSAVFNLERQQQKQVRLHEKQAKQAIIDHYHRGYGILPSAQQSFFLSPLRLRDLLIKKANDVTVNAAAAKLQGWYRGRLRRAAFLKEIRDNVNATKTVQRHFRAYRANVIIPRERAKAQAKATDVIQRCLRGYQARRLTLSAKADARADKLYEEFHRIDVITRGHFQRRVRRAWLAHRERKAEKARKAAEAAAAKKDKRFGGRRARPKPAAAAAPKAPEPAPVKAQSVAVSPLKKATTISPTKEPAAAGKPTLPKGVLPDQAKAQSVMTPALGGTMAPTNLLINLQQTAQPTEAPADTLVEGDSIFDHAATMRVDPSLGKLLESDPAGEDSIIDPEAAREGADLLDVINEKNSEDGEDAGGDQAKPEDGEEGAEQAEEDAGGEAQQEEAGADPDAGEGQPDAADELDRASDNAEVQEAME